jgi:hypothetical protein
MVNVKECTILKIEFVTYPDVLVCFFIQARSTL